MKEFNKKLLGIIMAFTLLISLIIPSVSKVFASAPANTGDYGALQINSNKTLIVSEVTDEESVSLTFKDGETTVGTATVTGTGLYTTGNNNLVYTNNDVTVTANPEDGYEVSMVLNGNNVTSPAEVTGFVAGGAPQIVDINFAEEGSDPGNGGGGNQQGNTNGTVHYEYTGVEAHITINGGEFDTNPVTNPDIAGAGGENGGQFDGPISYDYESGQVEVCVETLFTDRLTELTVNGVSVVTDDNKTPDELLHMTRGQTIHYIVNVDKADNYVISSTSVANEGEYMTVGNFLWSYMDVDKGTDDYIGYGNLELINLNYNGVDYSLEDIVLGDYGYIDWREWENNDTHQMEGGALLPAGATLTVRLMPKAGYQLTSFTINGGEIEAGDDYHVGIYTFEVPRGNFHLGAHFTKVNNEVDAEDAEVIESGSIKLGGLEESMTVGTAKLGIKDVELDPSQITNIKDAANGYDVKTYLDISLFNTIYKGTADDSWDNQVEELDHEATITLQLSDDVDGNDIVIVHELHEGDTIIGYEVIPTVFDPVKHTITFKTSSFSNYAIASRTVTSPKTGDNVGIYGLILILSLSGLVLYNKSKSVKKFK